jgi:hypothetical protein
MDQFWITAVTACGLGALACFIYWGPSMRILEGLTGKLPPELQYRIRMVAMFVNLAALCAVLLTHYLITQSHTQAARQFPSSSGNQRADDKDPGPIKEGSGKGDGDDRSPPPPPPPDNFEILTSISGEAAIRDTKMRNDKDDQSHFNVQFRIGQTVMAQDRQWGAGEYWGGPGTNHPAKFTLSEKENNLRLSKNGNPPRDLNLSVQSERDTNSDHEEDDVDIELWITIQTQTSLPDGRIIERRYASQKCEPLEFKLGYPGLAPSNAQKVGRETIVPITLQNAGESIRPQP